MAKMVGWNTKSFESECIGATMERLVLAAEAVRDEAKTILKSKLKGNWTEHGPYKKGNYPNEIWTERIKQAMVDTIRVVRKNDSMSREVWIMAGNFKTWWAVQMEYGHGQWKGGPRAFMRPALKNASEEMSAAIENGETR